MRKFFQLEACCFALPNGRTDTSKLIGIFATYAKAPKNPDPNLLLCFPQSIYYYYYRYSALGPVWAGTRAQSVDWYSSGRLHPGQVRRGSLPLLSPSLYIYIYIQGVSRLVEITAGGDFLGLCDQNISHKHVSDFGRLRSYDRLKLRIEGNDY